MSDNNENVNINILPSAQFKVFAENLVNFISHPFNEVLHTDELFNDQMKMAIIVLDGIYRREAKAVFDGIVEENIGNILWFTEHMLYERADYFDEVNYQSCLPFCVYLAILASYLYHHGIEGVLDIAAEYIAVVLSSVVHSDGMETLDTVAQSYEKYYPEREVFAVNVHKVADEINNAIAMDTINDLLHPNSKIMRMTNEIVEVHHHHHLNKIEIKENKIPILNVPFSGKSQTSASEPTARQMHLYCPESENSHLDFRAIPETSQDTNTAAGYQCFQSQSISATNVSFKRQISNKLGESENDSAKKRKTDCIVGKNQNVNKRLIRQH